MRRLIWRIAAIAAAAALAGGGFAWHIAERGLTTARRQIAARDFSGARNSLRRYLWLHPGDDAARFHLAEALVLDESEPAGSVGEALQHLQSIPDASPLAARARLQEGRLMLFVEQRPCAAEAALRRALLLDARLGEAQFTFWKLLDLTGRPHQAEEHFWRFVEQCSESERPERLRDWYLSQFTSRSGTMHTDRLMGFLSPGDPARDNPQLTRLQSFQRAEPGCPIPAAAIATLYHRDGQPQEALRILDEAARLPGALDNPFVLGAFIDVCLDLGQLDRAREMFDRWPEPRRGYDFWRRQGMILKEVVLDDERAAEAFERAEQVWPGHFDWESMNRRADCLTRLGHREQAETVRRRARDVMKLMEPELHTQLRKGLTRLDDAGTLRRMVQFYRGLDRPQEADAWQRVAEIAK